jgi:hypothetical protein
MRHQAKTLMSVQVVHRRIAMYSARFAFLAITLASLSLLSGCAGHSAEGDNPQSAAGQDLSASGAQSDATARFHQLKSGPTDKTLATLAVAANKIDAALIGTYKFLRPTTEGSDAGVRETRVKEVMHRFMCSFFDDSINIDHRTGATGAKKAVDDLDLSNNAGGDTSAVESAIGKIATDNDLDLMSGSASGNNTEGNVLGVYDKKNNEILFFGFSNCGSDN